MLDIIEEHQNLEHEHNKLKIDWDSLQEDCETKANEITR